MTRKLSTIWVELMVEQRAQRSRHIDLVIMKATFSGGE